MRGFQHLSEQNKKKRRVSSGRPKSNHRERRKNQICGHKQQGLSDGPAAPPPEARKWDRAVSRPAPKQAGQAGSGSHKAPQVRSARMAAPRSSSRHLPTALRRGLEADSTRLAMASVLLHRGQESERSPCLHFLPHVYSAGRHGVCHHHLLIHGTEYLWRNRHESASGGREPEDRGRGGEKSEGPTSTAFGYATTLTDHVYTAHSSSN